MLATIFLPLLFLFQAPGSGPVERQRQSEIQASPTPSPQPRTSPSPERDDQPVVSKHTVKIANRSLSYTSTTGFMPIKNAVSGETEARLFYIAYTLDDPPNKRPLMFSFNG